MDHDLRNGRGISTLARHEDYRQTRVILVTMSIDEPFYVGGTCLDVSQALVCVLSNRSILLLKDPFLRLAYTVIDGHDRSIASRVIRSNNRPIGQLRVGHAHEDYNVTLGFL